ncbi:uncharacterized protein P174DRAFT_478010 [Aspergillus novofumigatus IBT 16806]|uniref:Uncharacterized protein n=1 Tax=Aspergillus novofumigatus (strain IBT 16806) TaxID=1392255 RepID=A0A2I1CIR7_ASPN1|nr:uncharacterized protein P174DRAFT_478010 [Aspergillus novofumigatus IBT 16806]PKX97522.1 hypothetical protein P174DRAFT_478010 [Aspergillus novofumigatus IBT 16806]
MVHHTDDQSTGGKEGQGDMLLPAPATTYSPTIQCCHYSVLLCAPSNCRSQMRFGLRMSYLAITLLLDSSVHSAPLNRIYLVRLTDLKYHLPNHNQPACEVAGRRRSSQSASSDLLGAKVPSTWSYTAQLNLGRMVLRGLGKGTCFTTTSFPAQYSVSVLEDSPHAIASPGPVNPQTRRKRFSASALQVIAREDDGDNNQKKKYPKNISSQSQERLNSDAGNRTPSCCVRDSDVSHYTTSDNSWKYLTIIY